MCVYLPEDKNYNYMILNLHNKFAMFLMSHESFIITVIVSLNMQCLVFKPGECLASRDFFWCSTVCMHVCFVCVCPSGYKKRSRDIEPVYQVELVCYISKCNEVTIPA